MWMSRGGPLGQKCSSYRFYPWAHRVYVCMYVPGGGGDIEGRCGIKREGGPCAVVASLSPLSLARAVCFSSRQTVRSSEVRCIFFPSQQVAAPIHGLLPPDSSRDLLPLRMGPGLFYELLGHGYYVDYSRARQKGEQAGSRDVTMPLVYAPSSKLHRKMGR